MKKIVLGLISVLLILTLAGCPGPDFQGKPTSKTTLTQTLNAGGNVDLKNKSFSENAEINTAGIKVSNASLGGKTLTVNEAGVTLENIKNANLVIGEGVGDGNVSINNCSFNKVTVNGGGSNSVHFKKTTITTVVVSKQAVRVVLEESTQVVTAQINGNGAKIEAEPVVTAGETTAKVGTLEVAQNTSNVQIQKVEAESVVLKKNVANITVSDVKAESLEVQAEATVVLEGNTEVKTAEIKGDNAKIEAKADETTGVAAKVETLEVAPSTSNVQIQKIEAKKVIVKENVKNVTISEVKADTLEVKEKAENTTITGTTVKTIEIEKEVERIKIEACSITEAAKVSNAAGSVEVSGSTIEKLQVVKTKTTAEIKAVITVTKSESDTVINNAEVVVSGGKVTTQPITVVVADDVDTATLDVPETVAAVTLDDVSFDVSRVVNEYKTGKAFDPSNAFLILTYSNGTENSIAVNPDAITAEGFDSSAEGEITVTLKTTYNGETVESQPMTVTISTLPDYVGQGINLIMSGLYDEGVARFREYYNENPDSDEAKMVYALAELAALSTDESIANLLIDNFGFEEYPATMNSLINGDWLTEVPARESVSTYEFKESSYDGYIRCDIDESEELYDYRISYLYDEDYGYWISGNTYTRDPDTHTQEWNQLCITGVAIPSATGKYMLYSYDVEWPDLVNPESDAPTHVELDEDIPHWDWYINRSQDVLSSTSTLLPKIKMSNWLKESTAYKNSLLKGIENSETISLALTANLLDCNPDGINELLDSCIAVFENEDLENARRIVNSMNENITIPESLISIFGLEEMIGPDPIYFGKAEFNILLSALDIIKGTLQFISSYDLSINLYELKQTLADDIDLSIEVADKLLNEKSLAARSDAEARIAKAKASYTGALDSIVASYNAMFGNAEQEGYYPAFISEMVTPYADEYLPGVTALKDAISNGGVFYLPGVYFNSYGELAGIPSWNRTVNTNIDFGIDFGKLFTPGYLSNLFVRDKQGKIFTYTQMNVQYRYSSNQEPEKPLTPSITLDDSEEDGSYYLYEYDYETVPELAAPFDENAMMDTVKAEFAASGYTNGTVRFYYGYLCNTKVLIDLFANPPSNMKESDEQEVLSIIDNKTYHWNSYDKEWEIL